MSLREQLQKRFAGLAFNSYESDLYVLPPEGTINAVLDFIKNKQWSPIISYSDVEGQDWHGRYFIDVPFAHSKFWTDKGCRR